MLFASHKKEQIFTKENYNLLDVAKRDDLKSKLQEFKRNNYSKLKI